MPITFEDLPAPDAALLHRLIPLDQSMRGAACVLAQLGIRFRRLDPARAARWIEILEPHPFYKFGQVMFDLLEWEDYLLDGEQPAVSGDEVVAIANRVLAHADLDLEAVKLPGELPALETGFYLYRDVVLGIVWLVLEGG